VHIETPFGHALQEPGTTERVGCTLLARGVGARAARDAEQPILRLVPPSP